MCQMSPLVLHFSLISITNEDFVQHNCQHCFLTNRQQNHVLASDSCRCQRSNCEKRLHSSHTCSVVKNAIMVVGFIAYSHRKTEKHQNDKSYLCVVWLDRWIFTKFRVRVLIVYIVTNANEFLATVRAGYQHHGHTNSITFRYQSSIWGISLSTKHRTNSSINIDLCTLHCKHQICMVLV